MKEDPRLLFHTTCVPVTSPARSSRPDGQGGDRPRLFDSGRRAGFIARIRRPHAHPVLEGINHRRGELGASQRHGQLGSLVADGPYQGALIRIAREDHLPGFAPLLPSSAKVQPQTRQSPLRRYDTPSSSRPEPVGSVFQNSSAAGLKSCPPAARAVKIFQPSSVREAAQASFLKPTFLILALDGPSLGLRAVNDQNLSTLPPKEQVFFLMFRLKRPSILGLSSCFCPNRSHRDRLCPSVVRSLPINNGASSAEVAASRPNAGEGRACV